MAVKMIAHRGFSGRETENTAAAFVAAGNCTQAGIETDVHLTADGQFVILHDDCTARVSPVSLVAEHATMAQLRQIPLWDIDGRSVRGDLCLPTLEEYISICKRYHKIAVLEVKNHFTEGALSRLAAAIRAQDYLAQTVFISFDLANLQTLRVMLPTQPMQYLTGKYDAGVAAALDRWALDLDIYYRAVTPEVVRAVHDAGHLLNCWTVDDSADALRLERWGVDMITSNRLEHPAG